ncbi:acyltransferase family protein [Temperatibacter marinus]|uniref:Acyltransferase family protein n=1 Tax=Temperatibacter marinus TaxID=1456591 RepID=A0AA52EIP5_9PROT|nr:acyltransferase family protein [Temperatibacter marinus]WND03229.1 acyltransferase family protein [Temperatibacter marinus]
MNAGRRYDLDWIRVLVFGVLIFYHIGMIYVPWTFHLNSHPPIGWLELPMSFSSLFRLSLLFMISGIVSRYMLDKMQPGYFAQSRVTRLLVPLVVAVTVFLPPQAYVEAVDKAIFQGDYFTFWRTVYFSGSWPEGMMAPFPTYNHLWYVAYLFIYSLILAAMVSLYKKVCPESLLLSIKRGIDWALSGWRLLVLPLLYYFSISVPLTTHYAETHAFVGDWGAHSKYGFIFILGYLIAKREGSWATIYKALPLVALITVLSVLALLDARFSGDNFYVSSYDVGAVFRWSIILAIFGLGMRYLNKSSRPLEYLSSAVYPFYIIHQTILLISFFYIRTYDLEDSIEASLLILITFAGCFVFYEILKRLTYIRPLIGLKRT